MSYHEHKSMQAMRMISSENRKSLVFLEDLLLSLCMTLEKRMVKQGVFCKDIGFYAGTRTIKAGQTRLEWSDLCRME